MTRLEKLQAALRAAGDKGMTATELAAVVYDEEDGGPDDAGNCLCVMVRALRDKGVPIKTERRYILEGKCKSTRASS